MMMFRPFFSRAARCLLLSAAVLSLAACSYKIEIRQGNDLLVKNIEKLQPGMSKDEVSALLGRSLTPHVFRDDVWLYTYQIRDSGFIGEAKLIAVELVFEDEKLAEINRLKDDYQSEADAAEADAAEADTAEETEAEADGTEETEAEGEEEGGFSSFFRFFEDEEDDAEAEDAKQDDRQEESES